ncbi:MAG: cytochrome c-type biogenesis protein CcmH [Betaproteobacteria bacterium]|nr:MAG: cytochrome c-type biogenesis protein CcmH [Betaproteobacteria bacterium]
MLSKAITFVLLMVLAVAAWGKEAAPVAEDPVLERRLQTLSAELRCLVCQNESLAGSRAELAVDLRNQIRERMRQGQSDAEIVDYLVSRYGDFVLYRPPFKLTTLLLWLGPLLLIVAGLAALFYRLSRRREAPAIELTGSERERARALLSDSGRERL